LSTYTSFIGRAFAPFSVRVDPFQLKLFAKAIGETRPEYVDEAAAATAGRRGLLAPPTFLFSIWLQDPRSGQANSVLDLDVRRVLHGEQSFSYAAPIYSGDTITLQETIVDVYEKKNGALTFFVSEMSTKNQLGEGTGLMRCVTVLR
jgi:acyl dehydratase